MIDWQNSWNTSEKGRDAYAIIRKVDCDYNKQVLVNFLASHNSFPHFPHKINKKTGPTC